MKIYKIKPEFCVTVPDKLEEGVLYISKEFGTAIHLCACGCKEKTVTGLHPHWKKEWFLTENNGLVTLRPSIGNFSGQNPYHAHYYITDNKIDWL